jgi:hypothetical protein
MSLRWRELLDHLHVPWSDSSRYAGRGWIGIACPFCRDDPGFHLGINEEFGYYRCLRSEHHHGRSAPYLLRALGVGHHEIDALLPAYGGQGGGRDEPRRGTRPRPPSTPDDARREQLARCWARFEPAHQDRDACEYLQSRGFAHPMRTAEEFDLRVGRGKWARRLWFGLRDLDRQVVGFTGRSLDVWRKPRYFTQVADEQVLYLPRLPTPQHRLALIVEGPLDALRVADAARRRYHLLVIALCGMSLGGRKRLQLADVARQVPHFAVALDATVWAVDAQRLLAELRALPPLGQVSRWSLPPGRDDPGEMSDAEVEQWLATAS